MQDNSSSSNIVSRYSCFTSPPGTSIALSFTIVKSLLVLPLYIFVFYFGFRRWRQQRSFRTTSHSDVFTYHMAAIDLITTVADTVYYRGLFTADSRLRRGGVYLNALVFPGEVLIHCLTCVERYLAVVHPITYMGLRQRGGVRIRNTSIGCVWLMSCGFIGVTSHYYPVFPDIPYFCFLSASLVIVLFCSLSVLFVLVRPGPGDGDRDRVDRSKQKAFHTIMAILGVLILRFVVFLISLLISTEQVQTYSDKCLIFVSAFWFTIPSSLVLPVLFLIRAGKLPCC